MTLEEGLVTENWCYYCEGFRNAVWGTGTIPVDGADPVENVLRATCEVCGTVIALSPQATPRLREALASRRKRFRTTIRVQKDLATAVAAALSRTGVEPGDFDLLIRGFVIYLLASPRNWKSAIPLLREVDDSVLARPVDTSITFSLPPRVWNLLEELGDDTGIQNISDMVRRILVVVSKVGHKKSPPYVDAIRRLALVS